MQTELELMRRQLAIYGFLLIVASIWIITLVVVSVVLLRWLGMA